MIDKETIAKIKDLDIEEIAQFLGIEIKQHKAICFMHNDTDPSLSFKNNKYHCFGCNAHGDVIALVQVKLKCNFLEACKWLIDNFISGNSFQNVVKPHFNQNACKQSKSLDGHEFSEIYGVILSLLPKITPNNEIINTRKISLKILEQNHIKGLPLDNRQLINDLNSRFSENLLIKSGIYPISLKTKEPYFAFWGCDCLIPFYENDKVIYLQGISKFEHRSKGKRVNLSFIKLPDFYFPKVFPLSKKEIYIAEGSIDCLSFLSMDCNSIGILSANVSNFEKLTNFKDYHIIVATDFDSAGFDLKLKITEFLIKNHFSNDILDLNAFTKMVLNEDISSIKDINDLLRIIKK